MTKVLLTALASLLLSTSLFAAQPEFLITHNNTNEESNALIAGKVPSPYPTPAHDSRPIYWNMVRLACHGHIIKNTCSALIQMATNTSNPVELGYVTMDLLTGDISPKSLSRNGYRLTVNGPGETTIGYDK